MIDVKKFIKSFKFALEGINYALNNDQNLVIHFIAALCVVIASIVFDISPFEMGILGLTILLVIAAETINSAIEKMVDLITKEHRMEAKIAKDVASGMVLVTVIGSIIIAILVFTPYILRYFEWRI